MASPPLTITTKYAGGRQVGLSPPIPSESDNTIHNRYSRGGGRIIPSAKPRQILSKNTPPRLYPKDRMKECQNKDPVRVDRVSVWVTVGMKTIVITINVIILIYVGYKLDNHIFFQLNLGECIDKFHFLR